MTLSPSEIIRLLGNAYGSTELAGAGRPPWRPHGDPLAELVLTVLSQNTSDTNSGRAFARLMAAFPTWESVVGADVRQVEEAIRPGGLAQSKAPRIQALLREVGSRLSARGGSASGGGTWELSFLHDMPMEEARSWLRGLPGVGPKTAACVLLFALGKPALPVDTHVHRVAKRLGLVPAKASAEKSHDLLEAMLEPEEVYPFHVDLIKHGRRTCLAQRPRCPQCPLRHGCPSAATFYPAP